MNEPLTPEMSGAVCPDCGSKFYRDGHCLVCSTRRVHEQRQQMQQKSGPGYELAASRSRAGTAAWRAEGSPAKVVMVNDGIRAADGSVQRERRWFLAAPFRRGEFIEATPQQVDAWYAWHARRYQRTGNDR
jgi:hypothetical protein